MGEQPPGLWKGNLFEHRPVAERSNYMLRIRMTQTERRLWFAAAGGYSVAEMVRNLVNKEIGYDPVIKERKILGKPPRIPAVKPGTHCGYSGLPKVDCLCELCKKEN